MSVYAQDYAGNRSKAVKFENPYYEEPAPTEKPAAAVQQEQSGTAAKPAQAQAAPSGSTGSSAQSGNQGNTGSSAQSGNRGSTGGSAQSGNSGSSNTGTASK